MDNSYIQRIQNQFGGFCVKVLKNEANRILNEYAVQRANELSLDTFLEDKTLALPVIDRYFFNEHIFEVLGFCVVVKGDFLSDALSELPERLRAVILLYFFLGLNDREIGQYLDISHQAVAKNRAAALKKLEKMLKSEDY